jgi:hypothetical protein
MHKSRFQPSSSTAIPAISSTQPVSGRSFWASPPILMTASAPPSWRGQGGFADPRGGARRSADPFRHRDRRSCGGNPPHRTTGRTQSQRGRPYVIMEAPTGHRFRLTGPQSHVLAVERECLGRRVMLYRESGQYKTSYIADQAIFPIREDRIGMAIIGV